MRHHISHKWKAIIITVVSVLVVFYVEIVSYVLNSRYWVTLPSIKNAEAPLRILIVADPQILGERDESKYFGIVTRWDADSYLKRTFNLARNHVKPDVIIFLGDLFDEGSKASDAEYQRYYARFVDIFNVPKLHQPSTIRYVFVPGDNDVGGENEPISDIHLDWFNKTFGDYNELVSVQQKDVLSLQFMKYNQFFPQHLRQPLKDLKFRMNQDVPTYRILLSHYSLLKFIFEPIQDVLRSLKLSLVLSAHTHQSEYRRLDHEEDDSLHTTVAKHFLMSKSEVKNQRSHPDPEIEEPSRSTSFRFHLDKSPSGKIVHEISVPTCSYRMGVVDMGYGFMQMFPDGTVDYTVLWLPSRFSYLKIYLVYFGIVKIITSSFVYWKLFKYALGKYQEYKHRRNKAYHSV